MRIDIEPYGTSNRETADSVRDWLLRHVGHNITFRPGAILRLSCWQCSEHLHADGDKAESVVFHIEGVFDGASTAATSPTVR